MNPEIEIERLRNLVNGLEKDLYCKGITKGVSSLRVLSKVNTVSTTGSSSSDSDPPLAEKITEPPFFD